MICLFGHAWGKWEQFETTAKVLGYAYEPDKAEPPFNTNRQRRKCQRCGLVEEDRIR